MVPSIWSRAVRSPGSSLKPFIYGLAFEEGLAHPQTLIDDVPTRFGHYKPKNFDDSWSGTLSVAKALQLSLNIPAVKLLDKVGPPACSPVSGRSVLISKHLLVPNQTFRWYWAVLALAVQGSCSFLCGAGARRRND